MAHHLDPVVRIGRNGLTRGQMGNIARALRDHELIKVKFLEHKERKEELTSRIVDETGCSLVDIIGNIAILYKESEDPEKREIRL